MVMNLYAMALFISGLVFVLGFSLGYNITNLAAEQLRLEMPLYEYECFLCGHRFERIQRVGDDPVADCPECGGSVRRLLGVPALQFKGSGWYVTDYGKGTGGRAGEKPREKSSSEDSAPAAASKPPKKSSDTGRAGDAKE